ncbi:hypothetical protein Ciccas_008933 [Cichlidogyrus casuarinus]|uniref:Secreted protein n=1 Tax=Cichlidogyrus casuarinus TaxID=1844966 RepID=A0ABD2PYG7_9PLAT
MKLLRLCVLLPRQVHSEHVHSADGREPRIGLELVQVGDFPVTNFTHVQVNQLLRACPPSKWIKFRFRISSKTTLTSGPASHQVMLGFPDSISPPNKLVATMPLILIRQA